MKLQQLRYLCEIVDQRLNISNAAAALHTSQPGISRQIQLFEDELGTRLFIRNRKRIIALTQAGREILETARRMINDAENVRRIGQEFASGDSGDLTVATTHAFARYELPATVERFLQTHPGVRLKLRQGNPTDAARWVSAGEVDIGIGSEPLVSLPNVLLFPSVDLKRILLTKPDHPLLPERNVSLESIARYPMIIYDASFSGQTHIARLFAQRGLELNVVLTATDADVIKTYVKLGLGIAIVGTIVYRPEEDENLRAIDVSHLFAANTVYVSLRKDGYLRGYAYDFISTFAPKLTRSRIEREQQRRKEKR